MTNTRSVNEIKQFEEIFRINIGDMVDEYIAKHNFLVKKHKPTWRNFLSKNSSNQALSGHLDNVANASYKNIRALFREAHNLEAVEGIKLSKEFQSMTDKTLATENSYEGVHTLINNLNKYAL